MNRLRTAVLVAAGLLAAPLLAQEQVYVYVSYKDPSGASFRHKLDCLDSKCQASTNQVRRPIGLSDEQRRELLDALQAESKRFAVRADASATDALKVKLRYDSPGNRLSIERRLPGDKPADLAPGMIQVIKAHLGLDLSNPLLPGSAEQEAPGSEDQGK